MDDVTPEMKRLLNFIDGKEPEDDFTKELDEEVQSVRKNEKWRLDYMTLQMHYQEKYEQGLERGREEGRAEGETLGKGIEKVAIIRKKFNKGYDIIATADMLEQEISFIENIYNLIENHPEYTDLEIAEIVLKNR